MNVEALQAEVDALRAKLESYDGGDRPPSPPASLLLELFAAEDQLRLARREQAEGL